jgi:hypothetical protein
MTDPAININTVIFIVSDNIKIVISFGINPVNGGNPPPEIEEGWRWLGVV